MHALEKAPPSLFKRDIAKNFEIRPIKITLPQVKNKVEWKPMMRSVITKLINTIGTNLIPNNKGT